MKCFPATPAFCSGRPGWTSNSAGSHCFFGNLLPSEGVILEDFGFAHVVPSGREWAGAQGGIPPKAGHHEAAVLSSDHPPKKFVGPPVILHSILGKGVRGRVPCGIQASAPEPRVYPADAVQPRAGPPPGPVRSRHFLPFYPLEREKTKFWIFFFSGAAALILMKSAAGCDVSARRRPANSPSPFRRYRSMCSPRSGGRVPLSRGSGRP